MTELYNFGESLHYSKNTYDGMMKYRQIEAAKAVFDRTAPGPWSIRGNIIANSDSIIAAIGSWVGSEWDASANAVLIAAAPALLQRVLELESEVAQLKFDLSRAYTEGGGK